MVEVLKIDDTKESKRAKVEETWSPGEPRQKVDREQLVAWGDGDCRTAWKVELIDEGGGVGSYEPET